MGGDEDLARRIADCLDAPGEVAARARTAALGQTYAELDRDGRRRLLTILADRFGADRVQVEEAARRRLEARSESERLAAEARLRAALVPPYRRLLRRFTAVAGGVKFVVDLRADLMAIASRSPTLAALDAELKDLLSAWFDVGLLELQRITWESPAALLEKVIAYEAVHEIRSWRDLRNRLDSDRRCYALFHPSMPREPLSIVQVALVRGISTSIQRLLDESAPVGDPSSADTAIFYSISNAQRGLRGISFGEYLIKRALGELRRDLPQIRTFATLSPIPGFRVWLEARLARGDRGAPRWLEPGERARLEELARGEGGLRALLAKGPALARDPSWRALRGPLERLCARYFAERRGDGKPVDAVARFHFGNGASLERIHWMADTSRQGLRQSLGLMASYRYDPERIDEIQGAYENERHIAVSPSVHELLRRSGADLSRISLLSRAEA